MSVLADIFKVYGAVAFGTMLILGGVLLTVTVYDWLGVRRAHARDREYSTHAASQTALIARLEQIPTPGPWEMS